MLHIHAKWMDDGMILWSTEEPLTGDSFSAEIKYLPSLFKLFDEIFSSQDLFSYHSGVLNLKLPDRSGAIIENKVENVVVLSGMAFVDLCSSFKDELGEAFIFGESFVYWLNASKFLLKYLSRGLFYPSLRRRGLNIESRWELYWKDPNIQESIREFAKSMPGIASKSLGDDKESRFYLEQFLKIVSDSVIRSFLKGHQFFEDDILDVGGTKAGTKARRVDNLLGLWAMSLSTQQAVLPLSGVEQGLLESKVLQWNEALRSESDDMEAFIQIRIQDVNLDSPGEAFEKDWLADIELVDSKGKPILVESFENPAEWYFLYLKLLGQCLDVSRVLNRYLAIDFSSPVKLKVEDAHRLIASETRELDKINVKVIPPATWASVHDEVKVIFKLTSEEAGKDQSPSAFSLQSLVDFSWSLSIGDKEFTLEEFRNLSEGDNSILYKDGTWLSFDKELINQKIKDIEASLPNRRLSLFEALRLGMTGIESNDPIKIARIDAEGWIKQVVDFSTNFNPIENLPDTFKGELRPYQLVGLSWLSLISKIDIGGCLADDMGLGKTIQVLALLSIEKQEELALENPVHAPNLLVVPMSILGNWEAETKKFVPNLRVYTHHGAQRLAGNQFFDEVSKADIVLTTYSILHRDYRLFRKQTWKRIILDEAQNIKNVDAKQTKAVRALIDDIGDKKGSDRGVTRMPLRLALTGTPLENRLTELWSILDFLNPGLLGSIEDFKKRFVSQIERSRDSEHAKRLGKLVRPFILRRTKSDPAIISDLPEKIEMENVVHLTTEQAKLYQATLNDMLPKLKSSEGLHRKGIVLSTITKLKQICVHPELVLKNDAPLGGRSGKLEYLEELLETVIAEGDRVLIFTQFAQWGFKLAPHLQSKLDTYVPFFHGGLSRVDREKIIAAFQKEDGAKILVLSLKAGGFGLNLTSANQVVHLDQWWNPAVQAQATDRAYRIGQKSRVQVRTLISKGTLEERINEMHKQKMELTENVVGGARNSLTELSAEALEELLSLQTTSLID
jgi:SNF2 family DNA or RNA helicase